MEINDDKIPDMQTRRELQKYENALRKEIFDEAFLDQYDVEYYDEKLAKRWVSAAESKQQNFEEIIGEDFNSKAYGKDKPKQDTNYGKSYKEKYEALSEEGSDQGEAAGLVPRTYSMGAQPPPPGQPPVVSIEKIKQGKPPETEKPDKEEMETNSFSSSYQDKNEDEYFEHLSNAESDEENDIIESEEYRKTNKIIEEINNKNEQEKLMKSDKNEKAPAVIYANVIIQTDGPSEYSSSSEEEVNPRDLSMEKKETQIKRNIKRRKTSKSIEEEKLDQDIRKDNLEKLERENTPRKKREPPKKIEKQKANAHHLESEQEHDSTLSVLRSKETFHKINPSRAILKRKIF
ncbi:hypothetical protein JTB14_036287 [Gonioctena quinquepunctata]|nr:hypothetical protein JTB14_036287 [Gonioctena quinquepunctata]